jgi:hypothetical protein
LRSGHVNDKNEYKSTTEDAFYLTPVARYEANRDAIKILKNLNREGRFASADEQLVLAKYSGWGAIPHVFDTRETGSWKERREELSALLTKEEFQSASASTLSSFYTPPEITSSMWDALSRFGFAGGKVLDPATGTGAFIAASPDIPGIEFEAVEIDGISAQIASQLHQATMVQHSPYQNVVFEPNRFNAVITNVPFGDISIHEKRGNKTPGISPGAKIHDYFLLKNMHLTRVGGSPGGDYQPGNDG